MRIVCLMPTYGRIGYNPELLDQAVASFTDQTHRDAVLLIGNDTPRQRLQCSADRVDVLNFPRRFPTLGGKLQAMIDYSKTAYAPDAFCRWDDDDYSLPWRLETSARELERSGRLEWRPNNYWWFRAGLPDELHEVTRAGNTHVMALWRPDVLDVIGGYPDTTGDEDQRFNRELDRHGVSPMVGDDLTPMEIFYVYRWGVSQRHLSGRGGRREELDDHYKQIGELPIQRGTFEITPRSWDYPVVVKTIATARSDCTKRPYWQL